MNRKRTQTKHSKGRVKKSVKQPQHALYTEIIGFSIMGIALLVLTSLFTDKVGLVGKGIQNISVGLFGIGGYILPFCAIFIGWLYIRKDYPRIHRTLKYTIPFLMLLISFCHIFYYGNTISQSLLSMTYIKKGSYMNGGWLGAAIGYLLITLLGIYGSYITLSILFGIWLIGVTHFPFFSWIGEVAYVLRQKLIKIQNEKKTKEPKVKNQNTKNHTMSIPSKESKEEHPPIILSSQTNLENLRGQDVDEEDVWESPFQIEKTEELEVAKNKSRATKKTELKAQVQSENNSQNELQNEEDTMEEDHLQVASLYTFPSIDLLKKGETVSTQGTSSRASLSNAKKLEDTLASFGVEAKVIQIHKGPTVTRYELQPKQGVKVSKIVNLADDIALNLAAAGIRIEAPIPGKSAVGIEVPNEKSEIVYLRDVIESDNFAAFPSKLAFALGKDIAGKAMVTDIAKMPHVLIAGATGSGKSVCINTLITSILYKARPDEVKLIMIDPKVVELNVYNGIPHLLIPVVTDPKKAAGALAWAVNEMTKRYNAFAETNVRDIKGYNLKVEDATLKMPHIIIIIDELADLMMTAAKEVEEAICRLAQMARAAGIHLVIATQRPSVDVITGVIKANIPSRLAFAVSSGIDSRTILDSNGAEKLLGKGDMLFCPIGESKPIRIQGAFVSDKEVESIVEAVKRTGEVKYEETVIQSIEAPRIEIESSDEDEYLLEAISISQTKETMSISMLQRYFRIGFNRASRLMDALEARGIVGPDEGSKPRKVINKSSE